MSYRIGQEKLKRIFLKLVELQDEGMTVPASRRRVCQLFEITEYRLRQIEEEGINKQWPPLSENQTIQERAQWARQQRSQEPMPPEETEDEEEARRIKKYKGESGAAVAPPTTNAGRLRYPRSFPQE